MKMKIYLINKNVYIENFSQKYLKNYKNKEKKSGRFFFLDIFKMSIFQNPRWRILKGLDFCILLDDAVKMEKCWKNMAA